jgi:MoaE-MoaD fusion protein
MKVTVRLFAGLRERAGGQHVDVELPDGASVGDLLAAMASTPVGRLEPGQCVVAINREYAPASAVVRAEAEVALIPPVSGGDFRLSDEQLSLDAVVGEVARPEAGAIATFIGTTRSQSRDRSVEHLEYEAYEGMAEKVMAEIADELRARYDIDEIAIHHRTGRVDIGEASVVIAVSAAHRQDALAACKDAIDTLKERVPLWKKEVYEGGEEWLGKGS